MANWERNYKQRSVDVHKFAMVPRGDVPRSTFLRQTTHKTTFDAGYLVPVLVDEVLPGDTHSVRMTSFCRLATPLFPVMDNLTLESFFFFVPNRILWTNWKKMMGEQDNPGDSISFTTPQIVSKAGGYDANSVFDYMGLPTSGAPFPGGNTYSHNALPLRAYQRCYKDWFRDENLQNSPTINVGDGPDLYTDYSLFRRGKRKDYFTSALPWPQKGATAVSLPLQGTARVKGDGSFAQGQPQVERAGHADQMYLTSVVGTPQIVANANFGASAALAWQAVDQGLYADLSTATATTINALRLAFQTQKVLERDARGGTRYQELLMAHFGVRPLDARLQLPEYLGGGSSPITISPVAQTSGTSASGTTTPMGTLSAVGTGLASGHGFTQSFTEHGWIIGIVSVRADLSYQQGLRRMWSRATRYDYYLPAFAMLGEQSILNKEIYCDGSASDATVFGYQSRWDELRYFPAMITGQFRSTYATPLDGWHLAQKFAALPTLNTTFIQDTPPVSRIVAVGAGANGQQFIADMFFDIRSTRPLPMFSVPGLIDHF